MTLDEAARRLAEAGVDNPRADARLLLAHVLGISRDQTLNARPTNMRAAAIASSGIASIPDCRIFARTVLRLTEPVAP